MCSSQVRFIGAPQRRSKRGLTLDERPSEAVLWADESEIQPSSHTPKPTRHGTTLRPTVELIVQNHELQKFGPEFHKAGMKMGDTTGTIIPVNGFGKGGFLLWI